MHRSHLIRTLLALGCILAGAPAGLAQDPGEEPPAGSAQDPGVGPPVGPVAIPGGGLLLPAEDRPDAVIRLGSREVLRGRVEYLNYGQLHFNSDKLDKVEFDWDDVEYLAASEEYEYVFRGNFRFRGRGSVTRDEVWVQEADGTEYRMARSELLAIFPGREELRGGRWFGNVGLSYETTRGNSEDVSFDFTADTTARLGSGEILLDADSSYAEARGTETRRKHGLKTQGNLDVTDRYYWTIARAELDYDKFQNIALRVRAGTGPGINVIRTNDANLRLEAGYGYDSTKFRKVAPGEDDKDEFPVAYGSLRSDWDVKDDVDVSLTVDSYGSTANTSQATIDLTARLSYDLFQDVDLDLRLVWNHVQSPEPLADGTQPDRNDCAFHGRALLGLLRRMMVEPIPEPARQNYGWLFGGLVIMLLLLPFLSEAGAGSYLVQHGTIGACLIICDWTLAGTSCGSGAGSRWWVRRSWRPGWRSPSASGGSGPSPSGSTSFSSSPASPSSSATSSTTAASMRTRSPARRAATSSSD